ncbi:MAG TPA: DUF1573 domain-containing protein [Lacipirellulaceae bacterium]|jgi:hypothetical protein|nr:DUF1573 domain-containing protein [Lacipirellulaceae bacterium]
MQLTFKNSFGHWSFAAGAITLLFVLVALVLWNHFGSLAAARAFVRGDELAVLPAAIDLGACAEGGVRSVQFQVINMTGKPLALTGIHTSCSCIVASALPATIGGHAIFPLELTIHSPEHAGFFHREAILYADSQNSPQLLIEISGRTVAGNIQAEAVALAHQAAPGAIDIGGKDLKSYRKPDRSLPPGTTEQVAQPSEKK